MQVWTELHPFPSKSANMQQGIKLIEIVPDGLRVLLPFVTSFVYLLFGLRLFTHPDLPERGLLKCVCVCGVSTW